MLQEHFLWQFSLQVYRHPKLQALLLEAQDKAGADVNFILAALWLSDQGVMLTQAQVAALRHATQELAEQGIAPVRSLRKAWRHIKALQESRRTLQELELALEKQLQDKLYQALAPLVANTISCDQLTGIDLVKHLRWNLSLLIVSDGSAWGALVPKIEAEYLAIAGQIQSAMLG